MQLKDYRWYLEGEHEVFPGLLLNNITIRIISVHYTAETRVARNEVAFTEGDGIYKNVRSFNFTLPDESQESISAENIADFIQMNFPEAILITPGENV